LKAARRLVLYRAFVQTPISLLPTNILISPLYSATAGPISHKTAIIWRSDDVLTLWPWPLTLDLKRSLHVGGTWSTRTKLERNRKIFKNTKIFRVHNVSARLNLRRTIRVWVIYHLVNFRTFTPSVKLREG